jgi:cation diffusion facilitator CzcD-associated flavoprotein CzcO
MKIAIVGAGFAGLTTARHLKDFGHETTIYEKAPDVGGVWSRTRTYPGVSTQNGKDTYHLSDFPMPKSYPEWPSGPQVQAYLESYARHFGLARFLRLETEVLSAKQGGDGRWAVTARGPGGEATEDFDRLIVCSGIFSEPALPKFPGADAFKAAGGALCHTSQFLDVEKARGKRVVVVGYGKSSCDVAAALAGVASSLTVIVRELIWKAPKKFAGVLNYKFLLLTRMGEALFPYIRLKGFEAFLHGPGKFVRNQLVGGVQALTTAQLGLKKLGLVPRGDFERIARSTVSLVTEGFYEGVKEGKIVVKRDSEIRELVVDGGRTFASLSSGEKIPADIVICGTGWTQDVPFLDATVKVDLFDARGNFRLYRCILPAKVRNLAFNGYNSSFFSPLSAEMGALWIAAWLAGDLKLPPVEQQVAQTDERLAWMERRTEGKHARGTNIIPFSMHQIDELLEDLRLPISAFQRFVEWQVPVRPAAYQRVARGLKARLKAG